MQTNSPIQKKRSPFGWAKVKREVRRVFGLPGQAEWFDRLDWSDTKGVRQREYASYEDYCKHQASKFKRIRFPDSDEEQRIAWRDRFRDAGVLKPGDNVLCLGARLGTECKSFIDLGCFAIGVDLEPGPGNRYVVHGDFHQLQFAENSIDCVFTNALDHAFDIHRILDEVQRVLKPNGVFIAEITAGTQDEKGRDPGRFESMWWETLESVIEMTCQHQFQVHHRTAFSYPWDGEHVVFRSTVESQRNAA